MFKNGKLYYLPQVSAPYTEVINQLDDEDVEYKMLNINPNDLKPSQPFTLSHEVSSVELDNEKPIWISKDNNIVDGHNRSIKSILDNYSTIRAIQVNMDFNDACRILNKIQDIYEYQQKLSLEETTANDYINDYNDPDSDQTERDEILPVTDFLSRIEEDNELDSPEEKTIIGYRKEPVNNNSVVGNFFYLNPIKGYTKYEIIFNNLLDTNNLNINYKDGQNPVDILTKTWFPHMNFKLLSEKYNIDEEKIKNKAIAEKARSLGFDGIKYGESFLQGL